MSPLDLVPAAIDDIRRQIERARGEAALLAAPGTPEARRGEQLEQAYRARNPGLAALHDHAKQVPPQPVTGPADAGP